MENLILCCYCIPLNKLTVITIFGKFVDPVAMLDL